MTAKKKTKTTPATKATNSIKKKAKYPVGKRKVAGKKTAIGKQVVIGKKAVKAVAKKKVKSIQQKKTVTKTKNQKPVTNSRATTILHNRPDLHLIPVTGEIHPARLEETHQFEKAYKHNEETALHFEQQKAKQIMAITRGGSGKRIFKNRGQR